ncbi:PREDICTED: uncharacterized protein LOC105452632 [Wasmannia auropunctata]|uniref:uncharacterized protein LOC105452632 n=1 Tax=Wasmannia auropunctata TaxID=64793 RepID=UPI0005EF78C2|nr:PREDICTED: uncharacterized protein LOC105452632 [Wasmannia auropunctata]
MDRFSIVVLLCLYPSFKLVSGQTTAQPICTEIGAFEIYDGTCKNYYICVDDGEELNPVILSCASSAIFDYLQGKCVSESTATCQQTTTMAPSTTSAPLCLRYGRFPIPDVECKKYYLCYWDGISYTIMGNLTCPNTLIFNPLSEKCVSPQTYQCPGTVA